MRITTLYSILEDYMKEGVSDAPVYDMNGDELKYVDYVKSRSVINDTTETILLKFSSKERDEKTDEKEFENAVQEAWRENLVYPINRPPNEIGDKYKEIIR